MKKPLLLAVLECPSKWDFPKSLPLKKSCTEGWFQKRLPPGRFTASGERSHHRLLLELSCEFANGKWDCACMYMHTGDAQLPARRRTCRRLPRWHLSCRFAQKVYSHTLSLNLRKKWSQSSQLLACSIQTEAKTSHTHFYWSKAAEGNMGGLLMGLTWQLSSWLSDNGQKTKGSVCQFKQKLSEDDQ